MSEFSLSSTTPKKTHFSSLLLSDLFLFCSFVLSHPLYFSYFVFFSPYLLKLLSFLSPLFITTSLLLLALLTAFSPTLLHDRSHSELSEYKVSFILGTYQAVVERLRSKAENGNEEFNHFEELEAYKIVFETSNFDIGGNPVDVSEPEAKENCLANSEAQVHRCSIIHEGSDLGVYEVLKGKFDENLVGNKSIQVIAEVKKLGEELEDSTCQKGEKEVKPISVMPNKVEEQKEEASMTMRSGSKATRHKISEEKVNADDDDHEEFYSPKVNSPASPWSPDNGSGNFQTLGANLGSFGSMRKEKEWRRTLACKLFEERHNVDGGEGMDLLWETYEIDSIKMQAKSRSKKGKKGSIEYYDYGEGEEYDEEENEGQLCCLQALKFSAGKMNLGMGRPNLVKISKALKGIGWLHHVSGRGKKGNH